MRKTLIIATALQVLLAACHDAPTLPQAAFAADAVAAAAAARDAGLVRVTFPDPDPGIPGYLRLTPLLNQFFHTDGWLVIPIYRDPACIPVDFNLFDTFHVPGPDGPGAFGCTLLTHGAYLIEPDAPMGTFPIVVGSRGDAVPFWFVRWSEFQSVMADGVVTIADLAAMPSLVRATASQFTEVLQPRFENHHVVINAQGRLEDGRHFRFHVTHVGDQTTAIRLTLR